MARRRLVSTSISPMCSPICGACCSEVGERSMAQIEVKVPDIGDFKDVAVIEVMVKPGETIAVDTSLIMVESDKASMEIPSSHAGVVKEVRVKTGDKVSEGSPVVLLEGASGGAAGAAPPAASPAAAAPPPAAPRGAAGPGEKTVPTAAP